jgi:DsbC/DsbD-like thiol-disulfide interchange protein
MRSVTRALLQIAIFFAALSLVPAARGTTSDSAKFSHGYVNLVTETSSVQPGSEFVLGIHFTLEPGWHIYWVNSGDSGETPRITWQLPAGFSVGEIRWPAPSKLGSATVVDFGYERDVTLLIPIRVAATVAATQTASLVADVRLLICSNMCIPSKTAAKISISVKSQPPQIDGAGETLLREAQARLPQTAPSNWAFTAVETKDSFVLTAKMQGHLSPARFFPLFPSQIANEGPQNFTVSESGFQVKLKKSDELTGIVTRLKGVLTLQDGKTYQIDAPVQKSRQ